MGDISISLLLSILLLLLISMSLQPVFHFPQCSSQTGVYDFGQNTLPVFRFNFIEHGHDVVVEVDPSKRLAGFLFLFRREDFT